MNVQKSFFDSAEARRFASNIANSSNVLDNSDSNSRKLVGFACRDCVAGAAQGGSNGSDSRSWLFICDLPSVINTHSNHCMMIGNPKLYSLLSKSVSYITFFFTDWCSEKQMNGTTKAFMKATKQLDCQFHEMWITAMPFLGEKYKSCRETERIFSTLISISDFE